jgi:hypothetical protein
LEDVMIEVKISPLDAVPYEVESRAGFVAGAVAIAAAILAVAVAIFALGYSVGVEAVAPPRSALVEVSCDHPVFREAGYAVVEAHCVVYGSGEGAIVRLID